MQNDDIIKLAQKIIAGRMELDFFSRSSGSVIFRQDRESIRRDEAVTIIQALQANGIYAQLQETGHDYLIRIIPEYSRVKREKPLLNLVLFISSFITIGVTGSFIYFGPDWGLSILYSISLMAILTTHELGHYYYASRNRIHATLPFFIPFPILSPIGTLGAFIRMKSPIPDKRALFEVGIAGPIAGFVVSLFSLIVGFMLVPDEAGLREYISQFHPWTEDPEGALTLGSSILFNFLRHVMGAGHLPMYEVYHFPLIYAGWIGLLVTALNLMPIGQLDGGHISYALLGPKSKIVAVGAFIALALLNLYSTNWILWTILILFVIRLRHPPTMNDAVELKPNQRVLAWISYVIFVTCFPPMPIYFS